MSENILVRVLNKIEAVLKFPNLRKGEIGIQVGFDLSSKYASTDVVKMHYRTTRSGLVVAIDPDPANHLELQKIIERQKLSVCRVQKATYSETTNSKLVLGTRASYNTLEIVETDLSNYTSETIEVEMDTLDNIISELNLDYSKIRHVCITNNGAEYSTLLGMTSIFEKCKNLSLTIASGRPHRMGDIDGRPDYELILEFLAQHGFKGKLIRLNKSFWRGVIIHLLIKRKWVFNKTRFGFIIASRGNRKLKWYQSLY